MGNMYAGMRTNKTFGWKVKVIGVWTMDISMVCSLNQTKWLFTNYVDKICLFLTIYPPPLTFSTLSTLKKCQHFWTTYPPLLVNVVCEWPLSCAASSMK